MRIVTLKNRRRYDELEAGMLYSVVKSKLSPRLLETYYTWLDYQHRRSTLEALRDWLLVYSRHIVQAQEDVEGVLKNDQERRPNRRNNTYASAQNNRKTTSICFKCNKKHYIWNCYRFKSMSLKARWEFVREKKLCFKCLNSGHQSVKCDKDETCPISECRSRHHPCSTDISPKRVERIMLNSQLPPSNKMRNRDKFRMI